MTAAPLPHLRTGRPGGPTVVLLHGWACDGADLVDLAGALSDVADVVVPDLPGHGAATGRRRPEPLTLDDLADEIVSLVTVLGLSAPLLVGHSMGGAVALLAARAIAGAAAVTLDSAWAWVPAAVDVPSVDDAARRRDAVLARRRDAGVAAGTGGDPRALADLMASLVAWSQAGPHLGPEHVLGVLGARYAHLVDVSTGEREVSADGPGPVLLVLPDAGHWVHLDAPAPVVGALRDLLAARATTPHRASDSRCAAGR